MWTVCVADVVKRVRVAVSVPSFAITRLSRVFVWLPSVALTIEPEHVKSVTYEGSDTLSVSSNPALLKLYVVPFTLNLAVRAPASVAVSEPDPL